jgi:hypothetical protein
VSVSGEVFIGGSGTGSFLGGEVDVFGVGENATATIDGGSVDDDLDAGGNAVLTVVDIFVNDDVDAEDNGVMNLMGGLFDEDLTAADSSSINISGGQYVRVFSDGAELVAEEGTVNVTGGVFGEAGVDEGGTVLATLGGRVLFSGATIAGADSGTAPTATFSAKLNGEINISDVEFGDLAIDAGNCGKITIQDFAADDMTVATIGNGEVDVVSGEADALTVFAELGGLVNIRGGEFLDADLEAQSGSVITVFGSSFSVNGSPATFGAIPEVAGEIAGVLSDGTPFTATFRRQFFPVADAGQVVLAPEPASLAMLLLAICGVLGFRGRAT